MSTGSPHDDSRPVPGARITRRRAWVAGTLFAVLTAGAVVAATRQRDAKTAAPVVLDGSGASATTATSVATADSVPSGDVTQTTVAASDVPSSTTAPTTAAPIPTTVVPSAGTASCPLADGSSPRVTAFDGPPQQCIDPSASYTAIVQTTKGTLNIKLDPASAPKTVNNFVFLSRYHFYDGLTFHRVVPDFIIQGGDPEGTGNGGPGYTFADELPAAGSYEVGSVAMANGEPNANGSQFFIIVGNVGVEAVPPNYSLFGKVSKGQEVLRAIQRVGVKAADGTEAPPKVKVIIEKITIKATGEKAPVPTTAPAAPTTAAATTTALPPTTTA
jgi:cyclophilin family peptidyl-prolyl cis-trans isomerase